MGDKVEFVEVNTMNDPELSGKYGVQALPTTIVLDSTGNVVTQEVGFSDEAGYRLELRQALEKALSDR